MIHPTFLCIASHHLTPLIHRIQSNYSSSFHYDKSLHSLITQNALRLTAIQRNPLSILVHRSWRPTVTTIVIFIITIIITPHNSHRLNAPIRMPEPHGIPWGVALIRLLTVPHLNVIKWMSDCFMTK